VSKKQIPIRHKKKLEAIGILLRELRTSENITQKELCQDIYLHQNSVSRIENAQNISLVSFLEIVGAYDISLSEFFEVIDQY
jgi:transcriptional regulator with XRE-family HTH domain